MLRTEYCLARAERMRMLMLTAADPAAEIWLRGFVQNDRILAERAKSQEGLPSSAPQLVVSNAINWPPTVAAKHGQFRPGAAPVSGRPFEPASIPPLPVLLRLADRREAQLKRCAARRNFPRFRTWEIIDRRYAGATDRWRPVTAARC